MRADDLRCALTLADAGRFWQVGALADGADQRPEARVGAQHGRRQSGQLHLVIPHDAGAGLADALLEILVLFGKG